MSHSHVLLTFILFLLFETLLSDDDYYDEMDSHYDGWMEPITYGSLFKLQHQNSGHLLHSHEISWGSGSQQQSVTAYPTLGDGNSLWQIYAKDNNYTHASAVKCGNVIRLKHVKTGKWLHSHSNHRAPLSHKQEVTCFGDHSNSNDADLWKVICNKKGSSHPDIINWWRRSEPFSLQHFATKHYLYTSKKSEFNDGNCRGCPILGQLEVAASDKKVKGARWLPSHGFYYRPYDFVDDPGKYLQEQDIINENDGVKTDL